MDKGQKNRSFAWMLIAMLPLLPSLLCFITSFFFFYSSRQFWLHSPSPDFTMPLVSLFFLGIGLIYLVYGLKQRNIIDLPTERRLFFIISGGVFIIGFGGGSLLRFPDYCRSTSEAGCQLLWGTTIASALLIIFLFEAFTMRRKAKGKWTVKKESLEGEHKSTRTFRQSLFISTSRLTLVALLSGLPIIILGTFMSIFVGMGFGFGLATFAHGILNDLPVIIENSLETN